MYQCRLVKTTVVRPEPEGANRRNNDKNTIILVKATVVRPEPESANRRSNDKNTIILVN